MSKSAVYNPWASWNRWDWRFVVLLTAVLIRLQLAGSLVVQAQAGLTPAGISSMVLTRHYARIPFGTSLEIELSRARDARFISITLHATEATGLLAQVRP